MTAPLRHAAPAAAADASDLQVALDRASGTRAVRGNAIRHLPDSAAAITEMVNLIASAKRSIHLENYIIRDDRTGHRFADALEERLRSGQMEKAIAQGEVSDRLNQLYSGSSSVTGETAVEHSSR